MRTGHFISTTCLLALATACGNSEGDDRCFRVCEAANACGVAERPEDVECDHFCADVEKMQGRMQGAGFSSCEAEYDQHLSCWMGSLRQICNPDVCAETGTAWTKCMAPFCEANAAAVAEKVEGAVRDPNCNAPTRRAPSTPALEPF